jgi:hypothetical protein
MQKCVVICSCFGIALRSARENFQIELWVGARPRRRPYVDNEADARLSQEIDKFDDRRIAYGEKGVRFVALSGEGASPLILSVRCRKQKRALVERYCDFNEPTGSAGLVPLK